MDTLYKWTVRTFMILGFMAPFLGYFLSDFVPTISSDGLTLLYWLFGIEIFFSALLACFGYDKDSDPGTWFIVLFIQCVFFPIGIVMAIYFGKVFHDATSPIFVLLIITSMVVHWLIARGFVRGVNALMRSTYAGHISSMER